MNRRAQRLRLLAAAGLSALPLLPPAPSGADDQALLFDADGYRIAQFRTQVPEGVAGARTVGTDEVRRLTRTAGDDLVLIDVMPAPQKPRDLAETALWLPPGRNQIPGSVWLPNVGYGRLSDELDLHFRRTLERFTQGDSARPIVIYCVADCWMSWNAARRAAEYGYTRVLWYPEGTSGWEAAGLPLAKGTPLQPE